MTHSGPTRPRDGKDADAEPAGATPVVSSEELFRGSRQVVILHYGDRYILRVTRQGKLILNK